MQGPPPPFGYGPPPTGPYGYPPQQHAPYAGYPPPQPPPPQQFHPPPPPPPQPAAPPSATAAPGVPYIGARISLVSNMNIRYEGTLYTIDTKASTVALQNVRCFGTENRGSDGQGGGGYVPPSNDIYEFIIFGGRDIKDLAVLQAQEPPPLQDPAILSQQHAPPPPQQLLQQPAAEPVQPAQPEPVHEHEPVAQSEAHAQPQPQHKQQRQPRDNNRPQRGGHQGNKAHTVRMIHDDTKSHKPAVSSSSHQAAAPAKQQSVEEIKAEFDFNAANERFAKLAAPSTASSEPVPSYELPSAGDLDVNGLPVVKKAYNKSASFFDSLSTDKSGPREQSSNRRVDVDTFGSDAQHYRPRHGRGGGHRGPRRGGNRGGGGQGGGWRKDGQ